MKITITNFLTLDGVYQGPGSRDEDTTGGFDRGGWLVPHLDDAFIEQASKWLDQADGLLLGRRTYEAFARDWPQITDPKDPFTKRMNSLPKYVISNTLTQGDWKPTTVLQGNPIDTVTALKTRPGRELQIHASGQLGATLLAAGLIDTLRLAIAPTIIGDGRRLLSQSSPATGFRLAAHNITPAGVLLLEYESVGPAPIADYAGVAAIHQ